MKAILCVVDMTDSCDRVLDVAAQIANACGARLDVLYPYRLISDNLPGDMSSLRRRLETQAVEKFKQLKNTLPHLEKASPEFFPEIGFVPDRITAYIKRNAVDMVIIGQHFSDPPNDIKNIDLPSLIGNSQLPFVVVPTDVKTTVGK